MHIIEVASAKEIFVLFQKKKKSVFPYPTRFYAEITLPLLDFPLIDVVHSSVSTACEPLVIIGSCVENSESKRKI